MGLPANLAPGDKNRDERDQKLHHVGQPQPSPVERRRLYRDGWRGLVRWLERRRRSLGNYLGFRSLFFSLFGDIHAVSGGFNFNLSRLLDWMFTQWTKPSCKVPALTCR